MEVARESGRGPATAPVVLFVCMRDSGRAEMAAALLERMAGPTLSVACAGRNPRFPMHPLVAAVMGELGIDLLRYRSAPLTADQVRSADLVVTMGCGDACPLYSGKLYMDWKLEDPAGKDIETVRRVRDEIGWRIQGMAEALLRTAV